jgi:hypothetical protein
MPSILSEADKETVKRQVPKASNKIQAVAVARLYIAYPNPSKWTDTGLQGAAVLSNDLVGNTYWVKLVDVSVRWPLNHTVGRKGGDLLLILYRKQTEEWYGIKKSMIHGPIIKTEPSFTPSRLRLVLPDYLS